jgi:DNA-binding NtrC family response regulator
MQTSEALRTIPVIVLSAYRVLPEAIHTYAYAILRKPFDLTRLRELVAGLVSPSA